LRDSIHSLAEHSIELLHQLRERVNAPLRALQSFSSDHEVLLSICTGIRKEGWPEALTRRLEGSIPNFSREEVREIKNAHVRLNLAVLRLSEALGVRNPYEPAPKHLTALGQQAREIGVSLHRRLRDLRTQIEDFEAHYDGFTDHRREGLLAREYPRREPADYYPLTALRIDDLVNGLEDSQSQILLIPEFAQEGGLRGGFLRARLGERGFSTAATYFRQAEQQLLGKEWFQCCAHLRDAFEQVVLGVAKMAGWGGSGTSNALNHLAQVGIIPDDLRLSLQDHKAGLWGTLSVKGGHSAGGTQGTPADTESAALYCFDWTEAAADYLLNALDEQLEKPKTET